MPETSPPSGSSVVVGVGSTPSSGVVVGAAVGVCVEVVGAAVGVVGSSGSSEPQALTPAQSGHRPFRRVRAEAERREPRADGGAVEHRLRGDKVEEA